uniref:non-specific serine/threonine protein kinase n=1 Tax=Chenopodium quinoa TaxID=63459 RepID=A0A803LAY8_CHEQI
MNPTNVPVCWLTKNAMLNNSISVSSCPNHLFLPIHMDDNLAMDQIGGYIPNAAWNGFELKWNANSGSCEACLQSGGQCGHEPRSNKFFCFCSDESKCPFPGSTPYKVILTKSKIALIASFSAVGIGIIILLVFSLRKRCSSKDEDPQQKKKPDVEAFLKIHGTVGLQRHTYSDLKKITNSFRDKLGEGGFGIVYKGKVPNTERLVAVKMLKKSKGNAEDFINEVASIGKTNHINIVSLLGFCYEGRHQALVYDFMPNGSLEKNLYGKNSHHTLTWEELFQIAVGTARGLEYLHRGCNTRILHFDIKPHNILLDENLCPKISDFGLAKLCPQKESLISISEARGTVGYIAPEVFLRSFGGVSYKSDVYSYGMLVLEMVGCRRKNDVEGIECNSEQYFPQWIYQKLELGEEALDDQVMLSSDEKDIQKKMILVSLCCVKTNPSSRPEMSQVVDMLEGTVESLQISRISSLAPTSSYAGSLRSQSQTSSYSFSMTPTL